MNEQQIKWFTTYNGGLIDSLLIATEAEGYVKKVGNSFTKDLSYRYGWKQASDASSGEHEDDGSSNTYDRYVRNNVVRDVRGNVETQFNEREGNRTDAYKQIPITQFLDEWLEEYDSQNPIHKDNIQDSPLFNLSQDQVEHSNPFVQYPHLCNMLLIMKWIGAIQRIIQKPVILTKEDLNEVGIEYDLDQVVKLLSKCFPKTMVKNYYDPAAKTITCSIGGRELQTGHGKGFVKIDIGETGLIMARKMTDHALKVKEQLTKEILNNAI